MKRISVLKPMYQEEDLMELGNEIAKTQRAVNNLVDYANKHEVTQHTIKGLRSSNTRLHDFVKGYLKALEKGHNGHAEILKKERGLHG